MLDILIELFNTLHTSLEKTVSHKTRQERAQFLRRFFRDLSLKAGFKIAPDPRNLGQKHIHAMVQVWRGEHLAPATIQTYLSFLRGLAMWLGKPGFVRGPERAQRKPKKPNTSKMITTAPTSQMILFMIPSFPGLKRAKRLWFGRRKLAPLL